MNALGIPTPAGWGGRQPQNIAPVSSLLGRRYTDLATGYGGPVRGARTPSTFDEAVTGLPAHSTLARSAVRFGARQDAAHRGPLEASATDLRTDFGAGEGSARKIPVEGHEPSNHDLSASSRERVQTGLIARASPSIDRLPTHAGGDRSFWGRRRRQASRTGPRPLAGAPNRRGGRCSERGSRENGGRPPPFPERLRDLVDVPPRDGAAPCMRSGGVARQ